MVRFGYTILYVSDVEKSIEFYEKAFSFERKFISPENDYGEIISGETTISFASKELARTNLKEGFIESRLTEKPFAIELGFITDNVEQTAKQAENSGATIIESPKQKPWGQTVAYIRDIDGFLIELCTAIN
ncbi:VOC family protein [Flavobacterium cerinum]|uniref:VOC family protein n=1 Tax=Flavobacterium cerinum TaxID=2502784 RepID=A0A3S4T1G9_9FLAO|nr:VOC family protein [Flavobacterium cerinum]RWX00414.1 VOC family protein [Flavobacterium cerinum]